MGIKVVESTPIIVTDVLLCLWFPPKKKVAITASAVCFSDSDSFDTNSNTEINVLEKSPTILEEKACWEYLGSASDQDQGQNFRIKYRKKNQTTIARPIQYLSPNAQPNLQQLQPHDMLG